MPDKKRSPKQKAQSSKWLTSKEIEALLEDAAEAAEWLRTHPPGARLPDRFDHEEGNTDDI